MERLLRTIDTEPNVVEHIAGFDVMMALVSAGYGVGFANASLLSRYEHPEMIARPLAGRSAVLTTYCYGPMCHPPSS